MKDDQDITLETKRKNEILEAALKCFTRKGYHKTTMDDIRVEANLSKGALYWYFKSKDQLLHSAFEFWMMEMNEGFTALFDDVKDFRKTLSIIGEAIFAEVVAMKPLRGMFFEYLAHAGRKPELLELVSKYYSGWMTTLESFFERAEEEGRFKLKNKKVLVQHISAAIEGTFLIWFIDPDLIDPKKVWKTEIEFIISHIK